MAPRNRGRGSTNVWRMVYSIVWTVEKTGKQILKIDRKNDFFFLLANGAYLERVDFIFL